MNITKARNKGLKKYNSDKMSKAAIKTNKKSTSKALLKLATAILETFDVSYFIENLRFCSPSDRPAAIFKPKPEKTQTNFYLFQREDRFLLRTFNHQFVFAKQPAQRQI